MQSKMVFFRIMSTFFFVLLLTVVGYAQDFPSIQTTKPDRSEERIPENLKGSKSILFLAFTKQAETVLEDWYYPVYTMFIDESGFNALAYDCHVKMVMMFTGVGQSISDDILDKIRDNVDPSMNDYVLFYQGDFGQAMKELDLKKKNDAYVCVLDEDGKIIYQDQGQYSERKLDKIAELVEL